MIVLFLYATVLKGDELFFGKKKIHIQFKF